MSSLASFSTIKSSTTTDIVAPTASLAIGFGALNGGGSGTAEEKITALRAAGIEVADSPADLGVSVQKALRK